MATTAPPSTSIERFLPRDRERREPSLPASGGALTGGVATDGAAHRLRARRRQPLAPPRRRSPRPPRGLGRAPLPRVALPPRPRRSRAAARESRGAGRAHDTARARGGTTNFRGDRGCAGFRGRNRVRIRARHRLAPQAARGLGFELATGDEASIAAALPGDLLRGRCARAARTSRSACPRPGWERSSRRAADSELGTRSPPVRSVPGPRTGASRTLKILP